MDWLFAQPLDSVLSNRIILIVVATLVASAALSALSAVTVGGGKFAALGCMAVPIAFLGGNVMFMGIPSFPSADPLHLIPMVILTGLLAGIVIDTVTHIESTKLAVVLAWPALVVIAIGWREMPDFATIAGLPMALLWLCAVLGYLWMGLEHRFQSTPIVALFVMTLGLALLAFVGGSKIMTVLSGILAAALLGFFAFNWPNPRFPMLATGHLGIAGSVLVLAVALVLYTATPASAVAVLMLVFAAPPLAGRLPLGDGPKSGPIILMIVSVLPVIAAIAVALDVQGTLF
jgi:hypothetical protein